LESTDKGLRPQDIMVVPGPIFTKLGTFQQYTWKSPLLNFI